MELLSFIHVECWGDSTCNGVGHTGIGVAYFKQGVNNDKFLYLGSVITAKNFPGDFNVEGAPYVVKDGYVYVYYSDRDDNGNANIAVARTSLANLIAAARNGQPSPGWNKYYNGDWGQPGRDGDFTALNVPGHHIVHSGAAYSTYSKKFYLTTYVNSDQYRPFAGWPTGNYVFSSSPLTE